MAAKRRNSKRPHHSGQKPGQRKKSAAPSTSGVRVRKRPGEDAWEIVLPRCARDRQEDLEEVRKMLEAGESEVARDECLWLLQGCNECLDAHRILGEIALEQNDLQLARGHFGYAYRLGTKAIAQAGGTRPLPYRIAANQPFLESGKALAWCLKELGKLEMAQEVIDLLVECDHDDPLGVRNMLAGSPPTA